MFSSDQFQKNLMKIVASQIVVPNKKFFTLVNDYQAKKIVEPSGVLRLEVIEAKSLKKADFGYLGMRKSDPYVNIRICNHDFRTPTIPNTINPKWNFVCEALVYGSSSMQQINLEVMDEDQGSKDDFLGEVNFNLDPIVKNGIVDAKLNLEKTHTGQVHFKATWLEISHSKADMPPPEQLHGSHSSSRTSLFSSKQRPEVQTSLAAVLIYLDHGKNIPSASKVFGEPCTQIVFSLGSETRKSSDIRYSANPVWEEHYHILLDRLDPVQELKMDVIETRKNVQIGSIKIALASLLEMKDMTMTNPMFTNKFNDNFHIYASISLCFLREPLSKRVEFIQDEGVPDDGKLSDHIPTMENMVINTVETVAKTSGISEDIQEISQSERQAHYLSTRYDDEGTEVESCELSSE